MMTEKKKLNDPKWLQLPAAVLYCENRAFALARCKTSKRFHDAVGRYI